jgi:hypothetical protein
MAPPISGALLEITVEKCARLQLKSASFTEELAKVILEYYKCYFIFSTILM